MPPAYCQSYYYHAVNGCQVYARHCPELMMSTGVYGICILQMKKLRLKDDKMADWIKD